MMNSNTHKHRLALAAVVLTLSACGGGETKSTLAAEPAAPGPEAEAAPAAPVPEAPPAEPAGPRVTSLDDGPVDAGDLSDTYYHWQGETITVVGYPAQMFASAPWRDRVGLGSVAEPKAPELLHCKMASIPEGRTEVSQAVVLRGTFERRWYPTDPPRLELSGCELVGPAAEVPATGDAWKLDGDPIPVAALHDAAFGWQGETVQVTGRWVGTTTSRLKAGDVTRHDLQGTADTEPTVGCEQAGETRMPEATRTDRDVLVEGTIGESHPGKVTLEDCRLVEGA